MPKRFDDRQAVALGVRRHGDDGRQLVQRIEGGVIHFGWPYDPIAEPRVGADALTKLVGLPSLASNDDQGGIGVDGLEGVEQPGMVLAGFEGADDEDDRPFGQAVEKALIDRLG